MIILIHLFLTLFFSGLLGTKVTVLNGPVLAEDKDIGPNAVVKYRLLGPRVDLFTVDANTGNIIYPLQADTEEHLYTAVQVLMSLCVTVQVRYLCVRGRSWTVRHFRILE